MGVYGRNTPAETKMTAQILTVIVGIALIRFFSKREIVI